MSIDRKKYFLAALFLLFLSFPFLSGTSFNSAFALSGKVNPVGTNLIVEIAKKQNPAVVFVESKTKFRPAKGNPKQPRGHSVSINHLVNQVLLGDPVLFHNNPAQGMAVELDS